MTHQILSIPPTVAVTNGVVINLLLVIMALLIWDYTFMRSMQPNYGVYKTIEFFNPYNTRIYLNIIIKYT